MVGGMSGCVGHSHWYPSWNPPRAKSKHLVIGSNKYFDQLPGQCHPYFQKNVLRCPGMADPCKSCASCLFHDAGICLTSKFARGCCSTACHQSRPRGTRRVSPIICCRVSLLNLPLSSFSVRGHIKKNSQRLVPPAMGTWKREDIWEETRLSWAAFDVFGILIQMNLSYLILFDPIILFVDLQPFYLGNCGMLLHNNPV